VSVMVIDASIVAAWTLDDEHSDAGSRLLAEAQRCLRITSTLCWHEYRSILVVNQRRNRLLREALPSLLQKARRLGIQAYDSDDEQVLTLALHHNLTAYDAAYLALALDHDAILATNDKQLARAALACQLELRTLLETPL